MGEPDFRTKYLKAFGLMFFFSKTEAICHWYLRIAETQDTCASIQFETWRLFLPSSSNLSLEANILQQFCLHTVSSCVAYYLIKMQNLKMNLSGAKKNNYFLIEARHALHIWSAILQLQPPSSYVPRILRLTTQLKAEGFKVRAKASKKEFKIAITC